MYNTPYLDFLQHFNLQVDLRRKCLVDTITQLSVHATSFVSSAVRFPLLSVSSPSPFVSLLSQFSSVTRPCRYDTPVVHPVVHSIPTTGPSVFARPRRLPPDNLEIARQEFQQMQNLGIVRPSSSPWASPLHMVPKANGNWRPCSDYRASNKVSDADRFPIPHIQDFNSKLAGCTMFSKIDLV